MRPWVSCAAVTAVLSLVGAASAATLAHSYNLDGTLNDTNGGAPLTADGGSLTTNPGLYTFGAQQGLTVGNVLADPGDYSIEMKFAFDDLSGGYEKILDFHDRSADNGLYSHINHLVFYRGTDITNNQTVFTGSPVDVVLTRDAASGTVTGFANGAEEFSFADTNADAVFSAPNSVIHFFEDDNGTGGREASAGSVDFINLYDGALTAAEVAALPGTDPASIPAPSSLYGPAAFLAILSISRRPRRLHTTISA